MGRRTEVNFAFHDLHVTNEKKLAVFHLKLGESKLHEIKFINTNGIMAVTGSFGNYIFNQEFFPSGNINKVKVHENYWIKQLELNSVQQGKKYSIEETREKLLLGINGGLKTKGYKGDQLKDAISYYEKLLKYVTDKHQYLYNLHDYLPSFMNFTDVPYYFNIIKRLQCVFDAYEEICKRMVGNITYD